MSRIVVVVVCLTFSIAAGIFLEKCELPPSLKMEIRGYKDTVNHIIDFVIRGPAKGQVYKALANFVDRFGPRLSGTSVLEQSISALRRVAQKGGLQVSSQDVNVPYWTRGMESVTLLTPRRANISVLGLGGSISTPPYGIRAQVLVVTSFTELRQRAREANGKIVVLLPKWKGYFGTVQYRKQGAVEAAKVGAVAVLIRSMTDLNMGVPHTGQMFYDPDVPKIPGACISAEDAEMLYRMQQRNEMITMNVNLQSTDHGMRTSRNLIADVPGYEQPEKYVFVSGHTDSWDVGVGALDDGGGAFISLFTPLILKDLGLQARRTVRAIMWTAEEPGMYGAKAYKDQFYNEDIVLAIESDEGVFNPTGLLMHGSHKARCIIHEILQLLEPINATTLETNPTPGADIRIWADTEVPTAALRNDNERYFWYHHSVGDRMEVHDPGEMDRSLALFAAVSFVVADLRKPLPKNDDFDADDDVEWSQAKHRRREAVNPEWSPAKLPIRGAVIPEFIPLKSRPGTIKSDSLPTTGYRRPEDSGRWSPAKNRRREAVNPEWSLANHRMRGAVNPNIIPLKPMRPGISKSHSLPPPEYRRPEDSGRPPAKHRRRKVINPDWLLSNHRIRGAVNSELMPLNWRPGFSKYDSLPTAEDRRTEDSKSSPAKDRRREVVNPDWSLSKHEIRGAVSPELIPLTLKPGFPKSHSLPSPEYRRPEDSGRPPAKQRRRKVINPDWSLSNHRIRGAVNPELKPLNWRPGISKPHFLPTAEDRRTEDSKSSPAKDRRREVVKPDWSLSKHEIRGAVSPESIPLTLKPGFSKSHLLPSPEYRRPEDSRRSPAKQRRRKVINPDWSLSKHEIRGAVSSESIPLTLRPGTSKPNSLPQPEDRRTEESPAKHRRREVTNPDSSPPKDRIRGVVDPDLTPLTPSPGLSKPHSSPPPEVRTTEDSQWSPAKHRRTEAVNPDWTIANHRIRGAANPEFIPIKPSPGISKPHSLPTPEDRKTEDSERSPAKHRRGDVVNPDLSLANHRTRGAVNPEFIRKAVNPGPIPLKQKPGISKRNFLPPPEY